LLTKKHGGDEDEDLDHGAAKRRKIISGSVQDAGLTFGQGTGFAA
jgi:hypothetical protein